MQNMFLLHSVKHTEELILQTSVRHRRTACSVQAVQYSVFLWLIHSGAHAEVFMILLIRLPNQSLNAADKLNREAGKVRTEREYVTNCYLTSSRIKYIWPSFPRTRRDDRCFRLQSEADTVTSFFWAVKVDSFAQGLLQEKENVNWTECLTAENPNQRKLIASQGAHDSIVPIQKILSLSCVLK